MVFSPGDVINAEGRTAAADCDFKAVSDPQTGLVSFMITQDDETEDIEEFEVSLVDSTGFPDIRYYRATVCIIDDDKGTL